MIKLNGFKQWNEWFSNRKVKIEEVRGELEIPQNSGVVLIGNGAEYGSTKDDIIIQYAIAKGEFLIPIQDYAPSNIRAKNDEQKIALQILKDSKIPLKIISGVAGSGKTLLACAHAMQQLKQGNVLRVVIAKSMTPVGREIGFLKGGMDEKVKPWLGPFYDNFLQCGIPDYDIDDMMKSGVLEITPITYIQGRSITNAIIIIDEVQNLDLDVIKQIVTRAAEGSEIILLGDQTQKFEYKVRGHSLDELVRRGYNSPLVGHIHLEKSLRSPIADWAVLNL